MFAVTWVRPNPQSWFVLEGTDFRLLAMLRAFTPSGMLGARLDMCVLGKV